MTAQEGGSPLESKQPSGGLAQPASDATRIVAVSAGAGPRRSRLAVLGWLLCGAALGGAATWWAIALQLIAAPQSGAATHAEGAAPADANAPAAKAPATLYHCPMHPTITSDRPADCPICGMKLVPVAAATHEHATGASAPAAQTSPETDTPGRAAVNVDPARQQLIGLRTAKVEQAAVGGSWRSVGRVDVDPTRVRKANVKVDGYVEQIFVNFLGQRVSKGQPLFTLYSPTLLVTQNEYVSALRAHRASGSSAAEPPLLAAARRKLELWDVPQSVIARLGETGPQKTLTFVSPISGVVTSKNVVEGSFLQPGAEPYEITDLSVVWVMVDAYESDLARVKVGMQASMTVQAYPQRTFSGRVQFIAPLLDPSTRTAKVHLHFPNPTGELKPELYGEVTLQSETREGLTIPLDAVIHTGTKTVVFVAQGEGKFAPAVVQLGERSSDRVEVLSGLEAGQEVITRANFLIDSESQLRASLRDLADK